MPLTEEFVLRLCGVVLAPLELDVSDLLTNREDVDITHTRHDYPFQLY